MKILDVGTGPGFFPVILARAGYAVTAVDYTPGMLKKAGENLKKYAGDRAGEVTLLRMDAQDLSFADETFDVVLLRNLTWNLENPEQAYRKWYCVLKPGGILLNFDANWYGYLYDGKKGKLTSKTGSMWKSRPWKIIICVRISMPWRKLPFRYRSPESADPTATAGCWKRQDFRESGRMRISGRGSGAGRKS